LEEVGALPAGLDGAMKDERVKRLAANEALFRHANEALRKSDDSVVSIGGFLCECSIAECEERLEVSADVYQEVRSDVMRFVVKSDHANPEIERVVERKNGYDIVEKLGPGRDIAERLAPRRPPLG